MPNWCSNSMTVRDCTDEQIKRIVDAVEREQLLGEFYPEPNWRQTPNEDGVLPGPEYSHTWRRPGRPAWTTVDSSRFPDGSADERWYYWRNSHWGTKWEICDPTYEVVDGNVVIYFNTAWAPPSAEWFMQMSEAMPNADISCTFAEPGCDFYGLTVAKDGMASTSDACLSALKGEWIQRTLSPDKLAIYNNEDHEDHDDLVESLDEQWWDVESDEMDRALALM